LTSEKAPGGTQETRRESA